MLFDYNEAELVLIENKTKYPELSQNCVIMIGRMQPPTIAHYTLIGKMVKFIKEHNDLNITRLFVAVVEGEKSSHDTDRNPIPGKERVYIMQNSGHTGVIPKDSFIVVKSAFDAFVKVRRYLPPGTSYEEGMTPTGYEPIAVAAGSDRVDSYKELLDSKFTKPNGEKIKHFKIELPPRNSLFIDAPDEVLDTYIDELSEKLKEDKHFRLSTDDITKVSGTLVRRAVHKSEKEVFALLTGLSKNAPLANRLWKLMENVSE